MSFPKVFIERRVATTLLTLAIVFSGLAALTRLPSASLPEIDLPAIFVTAALPGANSETMAATVAAPLERRLSAIADVFEMGSQSSSGTTLIHLLFGLERSVDGAARDVQAAINAARGDLPANLPMNPTYGKVNLADAPLLHVSLTSSTLGLERLYEIATGELQEKLASVRGVGRVFVLGGSPVAVRVEADVALLSKYAIALEEVRAAIVAANANSPKGMVESGLRSFQIYANDEARTAEDYRDLIIAYRNGLPVRLSDVARVTEGMENPRNLAITNDQRSIVIKISRAAGSNVIETVDRIKQRLDELKRFLPEGVDIAIVSDRSLSIRSSLRALTHATLLSAALVMLAIFIFLGSARTTFVPAVAVPVSLVGSFGAMHVLGYSVNILSLMALTVASGLVVDDAIIVIENILRHIENGAPKRRAVIEGVEEVLFTVVVMSIALVAIFMPFLLIGGILFKFLAEFVVTLSVCILLSLLVSLTTVPMLCAAIFKEHRLRRSARFGRRIDEAFGRIVSRYGRTLDAVLLRRRLTLSVLGATIALNVLLMILVPKGLFPQQDVGRLFGFLHADRNASFESLSAKLAEICALLKADPAVDTVVGAIEAGQAANVAQIYVDLKEHEARAESIDEVNFRLTNALNLATGVSLTLTPQHDLVATGKSDGGQYQYTLQGDDIEELRLWSRRLTTALLDAPEVFNPISDQQEGGAVLDIDIDRDTAYRLGFSATLLDNALYDAYGGRQVSTVYGERNQRHVQLGAAPEYARRPIALDDAFVGLSGGPMSGVSSTNAPLTTISAVGDQTAGARIVNDIARNVAINSFAGKGRGSTSTAPAVSSIAAPMIPLSAFTRVSKSVAPLAVTHKDHFIAATISFGLPPKVSLGEATAAIERKAREIHVPASIHTGFSGAAAMFEKIAMKEAILVLAAIATIYIVLGILYESYIHPLTILSTIPSAGVGVLIALHALKVELTLIALMGMILLIGIVMKNAIMIVDVSLHLERTSGLSAEDAVRRACLSRFRPIMMTTLAALFGALPLAFGGGYGAELRQPLGVSVIGGLIVSQVLTLYTTPVVYLFLNKFRRSAANA
ncbi:efflux RND transporter permease subunit [Methylosinus sp. Sm6]|uniref:efflux RND transporter permease subunit n=1 Tax=Methylosinus sp. Sm6 TaxID=2866948 RepID=UPI001C997EB0|nr:efflux RND transporter permease subunit [Methylosinus sp. Sm6]MBY6243525.1 efflux RND transporter permease subunit [Methylosinus sp. Sm6]